MSSAKSENSLPRVCLNLPALCVNVAALPSIRSAMPLPVIWPENVAVPDWLNLVEESKTM